MFNKLEEIIKKLEGNILTFCLDDKLMDSFNKNNNVTLYAVSSNNQTNKKKKSKKLFSNSKGKSFNIKRIKKNINKKSVDTLICNMDYIFKYYKYFIKDSVYITKKNILIYATDKIDKDFIINKYKRYTKNIKVTDYKNGFIIDVDCKNTKNNFIKDILYFIVDTFNNIAEVIGNILVS